MMRVRFAGGLLAAGVLASAATACAPAAERASGNGPVADVAPVAATVTQPPSDRLTLLLEQALPNVKGKTFTSAVVDFPPSARAVPHRHGEAFVYAYVLEGAVRSQLGGEPVRTYQRGEDWIEPPCAEHVLAENPSRTEPAKLLVIFVSNTGDKIKIDQPSDQVSSPSGAGAGGAACRAPG
ncbi:cupin domain-containing protein [Sphaerisporangium dianthi]|uniref:Cupin domain-containing protein n=1 Tax=Sphaerisporangium dianthi TaxID=1436120 RepID=A0ABV9CAF9_9ACTN